MKIRDTSRFAGPEFDRFSGWNELGPFTVGPTSSHAIRTDPRRFLFSLARHKFVSKMLAGTKRVLEVGCSDGFGTQIVLQNVESVHGIDIDSECVDWARQNAIHEGLNCTFEVRNVMDGPLDGDYDSAYALDVIEHIPHEDEEQFLGNVVSALRATGTLIVGTPNATSEKYASVWSRAGHINLKSGESLRLMLEPLFENVFVFSMNDEVVHTGFYPMAHYLLALCTGLKVSDARS